MKKFMTFIFGLSLLIGVATVVLANDKTTKTKKAARQHKPVLEDAKKTSATTK